MKNKIDQVELVRRLRSYLGECVDHLTDEALLDLSAGTITRERVENSMALENLTRAFKAGFKKEIRLAKLAADKLSSVLKKLSLQNEK